MNASSSALLLSIALLCFRISLQKPNDLSTLRLVKSQWGSPPALNWTGVDPCGSNWVGVTCIGTRVANLLLPTMSLKGVLPSEIGQLTGLERLDLSSNPGLSGPIPSLGSLKSLQELVLVGCNFKGSIPPDLGNLGKLTRLDLNSNNLGGSIPAELGNLTNLYWFDIANNQLDGSLPVELGKLVKAGHFHFNKNYLNGSIPPQIFHENMILEHVLFDHNNFTGEIPSTLCLLPKITTLRLDGNRLEGPIPPNITNLTTLYEVHLSINKLNGTVPDLSALTNLQYLDLSNNSFDLSRFPIWFTKLSMITTIVMESTNLNGSFPVDVLDLKQLETLKVARNKISGKLDIDSVSQALVLADFEDNNIIGGFLGEAIRSRTTIKLAGNPACAAGSSLSNDAACSVSSETKPYVTHMKDCGNIKCGDQMQVDPRICECAVPYEGVFMFRAPRFSNIQSPTRFQNLEESLVLNLSLTEGSVYILCCMAFDASNYLNMTVRIFPSPGKKYFEPIVIVKMGNNLSSQSYNPPKEFGPYYFIANSRNLFQDFSTGSRSRLSTGVVIGIGIGAAVAVLTILGLGFYALKQKRKAEKAAKTSRPFGASWGFASGESSGDAPKLKGARWFSFQELKQATNNFSTENEIGSGGYGRVYKGMLAVGAQMVAVKRAAKESMQGGVEFRTEIELLSRVHHKNLVGLIGFCFEEAENMLVYEYMPNGSLRDNLSARTGIHLDWRKRIRIALGAARGLAYLHEHANPPIIHRDVKSSNILLDENLNAKVADFGLSKLITPADTGAGGHITTQVKGTMGYLDPDYFMTHQLSQKSDVYSFGVVLLEILTARQPIEKGRYLVREVRSVTDRGGINALLRHQLLDPVIRDGGLTLGGFESFVSLALRCSEDSATSRPKTSEVVKELEAIAEALGGNETHEEREMDSGFGIKGVGFSHYRGGFSDSFHNSGVYIIPPVEPK